jgi:pre-mRNA-splicing factor 18
MEVLKAEIEKKRKLTEDFAERSGVKKRYKTKGEVEEERVRQYHGDQQKEKEEKELKHQKEKEQEKESKKEDIKIEKADNTSSDSTIHNIAQNIKNNEKKEGESNNVKLPPHQEIVRRLRSLKQPITFFGDSDTQRFERLRKLEYELELTNVEHGRNEFFMRAAKEDVGSEFDHHSEEPEVQEVNKIEDSEITEADQKQDEENDREDEDRMDTVVVDGREQIREDFILYNLKRLLKEWEYELNGRADAEKRTAQGRMQTATFKQTKNYIRPLFKLLRLRGVPEDILEPVNEIIHDLRKREYVHANDIYLKMAIGNAPWPMGVTMVGIHERSAREKIFSNQVAHILNDETQRKYIQSLKRLMTFCQRKYPNIPSKCVG